MERLKLWRIKPVLRKTLFFREFKTIASSDLYVYLTEDKSVKGFIIIMKLSKIGTFVLDVLTIADLVKQKYVLIWCQQLTVLFGSKN